MKTVPITLAILGVLFSVGCTQPGETTGVAAATGGVVGAGLGAIVGNQSGDAGSGLALGALAGSATGALVGNALEAQQEAIRTQDEAIERQERMITAQRAEIEELRRVSQDSLSFRNSSAQGLNTKATNAAPAVRGREIALAGSGAAIRETTLRDAETSHPTAEQLVEIGRFGEAPGSDSNSALIEKGSTVGNRPSVRYTPLERGYFGVDSKTAKAPEQLPSEGRAVSALNTAAEPEKASFDWSKNDQEALTAPEPSPSAEFSRDGATDQASLTSECLRARDEVRAAEQALETPDKLFHYRRALRLCPDSAEFHNGLGEIYVTLNRDEDAQFEFQEALRLNPELGAARGNLQALIERRD